MKSRAQVCVDRHSHSLDDVRLFPPPAPLGRTLPPDSSHSYTFGLPDASVNTKNPVDPSHYPLLHSQNKPSFYGRRSTNCLSLDMLGDEQFLEFILWALQMLMSTNTPVLFLYLQCNLTCQLPTHECLGVFYVLMMKLRNVCVKLQRHYWKWQDCSFLLEKLQIGWQRSNSATFHQYTEHIY